MGDRPAIVEAAELATRGQPLCPTRGERACDSKRPHVRKTCVLYFRLVIHTPAAKRQHASAAYITASASCKR